MKYNKFTGCYSCSEKIVCQPVAYESDTIYDKFEPDPLLRIG
jgi:hypothetical protein